jgi:thiamine-phosphate pyrophosphorylase
MHIKNLKYFCYIDNFDKSFISNLPSTTSLIYRNYNTKKDLETIINVKKLCKTKRIKFYLSNDIKLALKLNLDGAYLPSFNKNFVHNAYNFKKKFQLLGSAHNIYEINIKKKQNINHIFLSPIFIKKNNRNPLGIYRFKNLVNKKIANLICLGGINQKNIKQINLIKPYGIASISLFKN